MLQAPADCRCLEDVDLEQLLLALSNTGPLPIVPLIKWLHLKTLSVYEP